MAGTPAGHGFGAVRISFTRPLLPRFLSSPGSPRREGLDRSFPTPVMIRGDGEIPVPTWHTWMSRCAARLPYGIRHGLHHCVGLINRNSPTNDIALHHPNG